MGFWLKVLGVGLAAAGVKRIKHNREEENKRVAEENRRAREEIRRRNTDCRFDGEISKDEFYAMVKRSGKGIRRIADLYAYGATVHGTVRSQSGVSEWRFTIDFNDYGKLTGTYWLSTGNGDSDIPRIVAARIAEQIRAFPNHLDDASDDDLRRERAQETHRTQTGARCPYCGEQIPNKEAKFCMYCGMRFRV